RAEVSKTKQSVYTKAHRGGWTPEDDDHFVYIAACTTVQVAAEDIKLKGGRLTIAIKNAINSLSAPDNVSYVTLFRSERRSYYKHREKAKSHPERFACLVQDGMDQAKLLLPRLTVIAHAYANARQLRTHLTGILNHGRQPKGYFDLFQYPHDANLTINILLLELTSMDYLPDVLYLQLDNCWRENKNQFVLNFLAILVKLDIFLKVKVNFLMVGHTHEDVDQMFNRLIEKEFKIQGWDKGQTPQIEGANLNTVLFGTSKVVPLAGGILVKDVPNKEEVVLDAGYLQNLSIGEYNVFETTASEDTVKQGSKSKDWLASIEVIEANIAVTQAVGSVLARQKGKTITHGCLAYLKTPGSIKTNVFIADQVPKHSDDLLQQLKGTNMLNVLPQTPSTQDPDLTTITKEEIKDKMCWVARRRGNVIVPPVSLGREEVMASNLSRQARFQIALERAKSPKDRKEMLGKVSLKVFKMEKVEPYSTSSKIQRTQEALKGTDISAVSDKRPSFMAHAVIEGTDKPKGGSGDAFVFQVTNHNAKPEDTVHICILYFQFDGRIAALYPKNEGRSIELRGGDTAEEIYKITMARNSLRTMAEPDPSKAEPNM
ncbi:hypothetical protein QZH41_016659, partial [Actinostola sp. cb2023]